MYNCVWSLLVDLNEHNVHVAVDPWLLPIEIVAMTGLAMGIGCISVNQYTKHTTLTFVHYHNAKMNLWKWSAMTWDDIKGYPLTRLLPTDY